MVGLYLMFVLCLPYLANAGDACPTVTPVSPFNLEKFSTGRWFEMARYSNFKFDKNIDCIYYDYSSNSQAYKFNINIVRNKHTSTSSAWADYAPGSENIGSIYESVLVDKEGINSTYSILETDYDNYALLLFCDMDDETNKKTESAWIVTRTSQLGEVRSEMEDLIKKYTFLDTNNFKWYNFTEKTCLLDL